MDIKVNNIGQTAQVAGPEQPKEVNGDFKFMLTSKLEDTGLAERLNLTLQDIVQQGERIAKRKYGIQSFGVFVKRTDKRIAAKKRRCRPRRRR